MSKPLIDDCFRPGQEFLRHEEAIALLRARIAPTAGIVQLPLAEASGRILAAATIARSPVPAHNNSAVDGYAFAHAACSGSGSNAWTVEGRAAAGHPFKGQLPAGRLVRIFTGAVVPDGADTVIMQEDTDLHPEAPNRVSMRGVPKAGANVRRAGEDVQAGETLLPAGTLIRPQDLAALASIGLGEVPCYRRLRVGVVSTGDEVVEAGVRALASGEVYDANAPMLRALCLAAGADVVDLGILSDRDEIVRDTLAKAAAEYDLVLTTGGASRGEEDHVAAAIGAMGTRHFWQIQIKPGRPMMLGQIGQTAIVGLPGNPVAVFVCFLMYVWPMLRRLGGSDWREPRRFLLPAAFAFPKRKVGRREFWRGTMREGPGGWSVEKFERDGSGLISSLRQADCLIDIPEEVEAVRPGDPVAVIPFSEFGIGRT